VDGRTMLLSAMGDANGEENVGASTGNVGCFP
jgi:hypothetical protein